MDDVQEMLPLLIAAVDERYKGLHLVILIVAPLFLSYLLWVYAKSRVARGAPRAVLWASLVPLLVGAFLGYRPFKALDDVLYTEFEGLTQRSEMLHYAAFFVPCVATLLMVVLILVSNYRERMEQ